MFALDILERAVMDGDLSIASCLEKPDALWIFESLEAALLQTKGLGSVIEVKQDGWLRSLATPVPTQRAVRKGECSSYIDSGEEVEELR